jgi:aspartate aminotransferase
MPKLSHRSTRVPESPFRKLGGLAAAAKARGTEVIHLNIGQPDIPTPPRALERFSRQLPDVVAYNPGIGSLEYRKKLTGYYARFGVELAPDDLLITAGASEALQLLFFALTDPGDRLLTPEPYYANYLGFAEIAGIHLDTIPGDTERGFPLPPLDEFESRCGPLTKGILLNVPANPSGSCYDPGHIQALLRWAEEKDLFVIADEVYREFVYDGRKPFCSLSWGLARQQLIVVDSISKRYSACGARVGNVASLNRELLTSLGRYAKLRLSPPAMGELLAGIILEEEGNYLQEVVAEYGNRRACVYNRLKAMPGVTTYLPGGAFYCFAQLPVEDADHFCRFLLEDFSYEGATLMLSPGAAFHQDPAQGRQLVRIAFVRGKDQLEQGMDILEQALEAYPKRIRAMQPAFR